MSKKEKQGKKLKLSSSTCPRPYRIPSIAVANINDDSKPSSQVTEALKYIGNPPILQDQSWTKAVPFKDCFRYVKPSESIASSYTPSASKFNINKLSRKRKKEMKSITFNFYDENGELDYPPRKYVQAFEQEMKERKIEKMKLLESTPQNIINLTDLADGTWLQRKEEKRLLTIRKEQKRIKQQLQNEAIQKILEQQELIKREADMPQSIESQRTELLNAIENEQKDIYSQSDTSISRINYFIKEAINDYHIEPYDLINIDEAQKRLWDKLKKIKNFHHVMKELEVEIIDDYKQSVRFAIIDYILLDPFERERLGIDVIPIQYPVTHIRAPVPWHQTVISSTHYSEHNLFIGNEIMTGIRQIWFNK